MVFVISLPPSLPPSLGMNFAYSFHHPPSTPLPMPGGIHLSHPPPPPGCDSSATASLQSPLNSPLALNSPTCLTSPASSHMSTDSSLMGGMVPFQHHELKSPSHVSPDPSLLPPTYGSLSSPTLPPPLLANSVPFLHEQSYSHISHSIPHPPPPLHQDHLMGQSQELAPSAMKSHPPVLSHTPMVTAE